jgi:hypothetical protein
LRQMACMSPVVGSGYWVLGIGYWMRFLKSHSAFYAPP